MAPRNNFTVGRCHGSPPIMSASQSILRLSPAQDGIWNIDSSHSYRRIAFVCSFGAYPPHTSPVECVSDGNRPSVIEIDDYFGSA